ncbi:MAG TPA: hypothetical protein GX733_06875 [Tissierellia bacterium]|nr:hypothetical protein [Tissierellia bacterium]
MTSQRLLRAFLIASVVVMLSLLVQSVLFLRLLPPSPGVAELLYYLRLDQLLSAVVFTIVMFQVKKQWEAGRRKGLMLLQIYTLILVMYAFEHGQAFRAGGSLMHLGYAVLLGAVALLGMVAYYIKQRESYRKE